MKMRPRSFAIDGPPPNPSRSPLTRMRFAPWSATSFLLCESRIDPSDPIESLHDVQISPDDDTYPCSCPLRLVDAVSQLPLSPILSGLSSNRLSNHSMSFPVSLLTGDCRSMVSS